MKQVNAYKMLGPWLGVWHEGSVFSHYYNYSNNHDDDDDSPKDLSVISILKIWLQTLFFFLLQVSSSACFKEYVSILGKNTRSFDVCHSILEDQRGFKWRDGQPTHLGLLGPFLVLAQKVPYPGKPHSSGPTRTFGHLIYRTDSGCTVSHGTRM